MKVALIGDVHGNLPALEAVLEDAKKRKVEAVWNLGDFVGYGPFPDATVKKIKHIKALSIIGNYDSKTLAIYDQSPKWTKKRIPEKRIAFRWAHDNLSMESVHYLNALPSQLSFTVSGRKILLVHASPVSNKEHLAPDTPIERLKELALSTDADVIICAHSHQHFVKKVAGTWFINTGSVGRPDDGDPRACYATLHIGKGKYLRVKHHRVAYDVARSVQAIRDQGLPESFAQMLVHGRGLDFVLENWAHIKTSEKQTED